MENQNITAVEIADMRKDVANAQQVQYGVERRYARALNSMFAFAWYTFEHNDVSDSAKAVKAEKELLYTDLKAANHKNPSTTWARIRKYGKEEAKTAGQFGETPDAEGGAGEGEGAGDRGRSPMLRNVEELTALYKFNARQDSLPKEVYNAQQYIVAALKELGVDVSLVK
jgi:hypothetical protein